MEEISIMQIKCPNCGAECETEGELAVGQHVICPYCSEKFTYDGAGQGNHAEENCRREVTTKCPHCGTVYEVDESLEGNTCQCSVCNKDFVVNVVQFVEVSGEHSSALTADEKEESKAYVSDKLAEEMNKATKAGNMQDAEIETVGSGKSLLFKVKTVLITTKKKIIVWWKNGEEGRHLFFSKVKVTAIRTKDGVIAWWNGGKDGRYTFFCKAKATAISAKDKTIALWKSGRMGKTIICATALLAIYAILPSFKKDNVDSKRPEIAKSLTDLDKALAALDGQDSYHKRNNSKSAERSNVEPLKTDLGGEQKDRWLRQIFDLAQSPAANDDTINFYGFFPGMSRHDAQVLAEYYNLDGDECRIYTVGEKGVYSITLDIKAVARILKTVSRVLKTDVAVGTYEEIAQAVANAVGDLQSKGTRNVTGERWGDRTYFDEHVSQWYERASVDGTYLKLARNGMAITGNKNLMSRMPVETASAKSQRLETTKTVIQNLLNSMVDVPVKSSGLKPFKMSKYEVTQLQWTHVMGNNPSEHMSSQIGSRNSGDCPVDDVSWDDCQEFLKEFNALPEVKKTGLTFRLPTVEEWEYACRAGASDGVCKLANGREIFKTRIDEVAWIEVADGIMRPVGLKTPNAFGMFDLIGNASEWTCSWDKKYKDRCIVIGGRCNSQWNDDSSKKLWRDSKRSNYKRGKLGFRLCASKDNGDGPGTGMRKFGASYKIGDHTWTYDVIDGEATITGVSPKAGDITIPSKIGADKYPVAIVGKRALSGIESGMRSGRRGSRSGRGDRSDSADATRLTIPDSVREIGEGAFAQCHGLMDLTIPDSVKSIGNEAFADCGNLAKVKIGNSVTNIGEKAFSNCSSLESIVMPDSVAAFDASTFGGCASLTSVTIGNGVTRIESRAFECFDNLTSVTIGNGVTHIEDKAFNNCRNLASLKIGNSVTVIGEEAFELCKSLASVKFPDSLATIGDGAFRSCKGLTVVKIPDSVISIGNSAFDGCDGLTSLKIGKSVSAIGAAAFRDCKGLTTVNIPGSVEYVGGGQLAGAFARCGLTSVTIGYGVKEIGSRAFWACYSLEDVAIPDSVTSIGEEAFSQCGLKNVTIGKGVKIIGKEAFSSCKFTNVTIPDNVERIEEGAFHYCAAMTSVTIGNGVTRIGNRAFSYCNNLTSVKFGKSVSIIGGSAFSDCRNLESVMLPDSVESIGKDAFRWCSKLKDVKAPKRFLPLKTN